MISDEQTFLHPVTEAEDFRSDHERLADYILDQPAIAVEIGGMRWSRRSALVLAIHWMEQGMTAEAVLRRIEMLASFREDVEQPPHAVLVVDDEPVLRDLVAGILQPAGYEVMTAANGLEAVEVIRRKRPSLVLMDLMMPGLDGPGAIKAIRSDPEIADISIIAMSAGRNLWQMVDKLDVDSIIGKPFDIDALLAEVAIQLRRSGAC